MKKKVIATMMTAVMVVSLECTAFAVGADITKETIGAAGITTSISVAADFVETRLVVADEVNIRASASSTSNIVARYVKGDTAYLVGRSDNWIKVMFGDNIGYISVYDLVEKLAPVIAEKAIVKTDVVNVRVAPDVNSAVSAVYKRDDVVDVVGYHEDSNQWLRVTFSGQIGYVLAVDLFGLPIISQKTITSDSIPLRALPDGYSPILAYYKKGDIAYIVGVEGNWLKVVANGKYAYILGYEKSDIYETRTLIADMSEVRIAPNSNAPIIAKYAKGDQVAILKDTDNQQLRDGKWVDGRWEEGSWVKVFFNTDVGYLLAYDLDIVPEIIDTKNVVASAVSIRSAANANARAVGRLVVGDVAYIVGSENGWLQVVFGNGTGFIPSNTVK